MKFSTGPEYLIRLDSTAMADIIFNLLIFFLLSSSFMLESGLKLELPKAVEPVSLPMNEVVVTLTEGGGLLVGDQSVPWTDLDPELARALERSKERKVVVRGDDRVALGRVVDVMDAARRLGASGLAIAAEPKETPLSRRNR